MKIFQDRITGMLMLTAFIALVIGSACKKDKNDPSPVMRVGLIVDEAGIDDKTFNQSTYEGIVRAQQEMGFDFDYKVGFEVGDYDGIIEQFIADGKTLVIGPGYKLANAFTGAAISHPEIHFLLLDFAPVEIPENMSCVIFQSNEASYLCGFLAAFWAYHSDPDQPEAGWISGPPIEAIQTITSGFKGGMEYFNSKYNINVNFYGISITSFVDSVGAADSAQMMIENGMDIIFSFAGDGGNGALAKTKELGKWAIGMDSDQYISFPEVQDILLTSCIKNLGEITYQQLINHSANNFGGGNIITGNLENGGVALAPYHDYETLIPDSIKTEIESIKNGIIEGTIHAGSVKYPH